MIYLQFNRELLIATLLIRNTKDKCNLEYSQTCYGKNAVSSYNINYNRQRRRVWYFTYECNYIVNMLIIPEITPVTTPRV